MAETRSENDTEIWKKFLASDDRYYSKMLQISRVNLSFPKEEASRELFKGEEFACQ